MTNITEITKPCPFCGCPSEEISLQQRKDADGHVYWQITCLDCGIKTERCYDEDAVFLNLSDGRSAALALWDMRISPNRYSPFRNSPRV